MQIKTRFDVEQAWQARVAERLQAGDSIEAATAYARQMVAEPGSEAEKYLAEIEKQ